MGRNGFFIVPLESLWDCNGSLWVLIDLQAS